MPVGLLIVCVVCAYSEWFLAVMAFSAVADQRDPKYSDNNMLGASGGLMIFCGVTLWFYTSFFLFAYYRDLHPKHRFLYITEMTCDFLYVLYLFAACKCISPLSSS